MLIVDASALYEVVSSARRAELIRSRLEADPDLAAPHVIDVEVLSTIRRDYLMGRLDLTLARQASVDLQAWPGERFDHLNLISRAWELRNNVRAWDAFYVALAEELQGTLITLDTRLANATGIRCSVEVIR